MTPLQSMVLFMRNPNPRYHQSNNANFAHLAPAFFAKPNPHVPAFKKLPDGSLQANFTAVVHGSIQRFNDEPVVVSEPLIEGMDYFIYACTDGFLVASISAIAPSDYALNECRQVGGFHYSGIPASATLASGQFAVSGQDVVWNQQMLDDIKGINKYSLWDLHWRPACPDPRGMAYIPELRIWADIYFTNTTHELGTSRHGSNVASGTVLPLKPLSRGGNGVVAYPRFGWWEACEIAAVAGKRLLTNREFDNATIGVTENTSLGGASETIPLSQFEPRFTSIHGLHQVTGCHWTWGEDHGQREMGATASAWSYRNVTGTPLRGQIYTETSISDVRVILGGARPNGSLSGSRAALWSYSPWLSAWSIGVRCACDHLQLV